MYSMMHSTVVVVAHPSHIYIRHLLDLMTSDDLDGKL